MSDAPPEPAELVEIRCSYSRCRPAIGCVDGPALLGVCDTPTDAHGLVCGRAAAELSNQNT